MIAQDTWDYFVDSLQRSILFWNTMRKRGDNFLEHFRAGQPPVLAFGYEIIMDGRQLERPVSFALARILDRREIPRNPEEISEAPKRPIVIIDPRAGHGPGIGGSKMNSEIGVALDKGHPVYFVLFFIHPEPGQTIADVLSAEAIFIEEVIRRHPDSGRPAVLGNCQAGWASALMCAERPELLGILVMNGAPLSYWSGLEGVNPMRYFGGLCGGVWLTDYLSDIGSGEFDGAYLVQNFELLNPANTFWKKQYNLYSRIDTEQDRYLGFEKWWGGFFLMAAEEIHFIVDNLFIGNKLENDRLELRAGASINLKNINHPIVVFCSRGDNITPPQQALDWIPQVYESDREIRELGKIIIYLVHENIGHLGIFVSGMIAGKEHREIIGNLEVMKSLPAGLYEMVITESQGEHGETLFNSRFERRTIAEMLECIGGIETDRYGEEFGDFRRVYELSRFNRYLYRALFRPWIRMFAHGLISIMAKLLHPSRTQYYLLSSLNPFLWPAALAAPFAVQYRKPVREENPYLRMEREFSKIVEDSFNLYRDMRDLYAETLFRFVYGSGYMRLMFPRRPSGDRRR
ncbi:MAG: DUF3141 domain-containing protein [Syntrophaceae bacterium]